MFIRIITFDEACSKATNASFTSWNDRTYWLYNLQKYRWDWPVWGKLFKIDPGKCIHKTKKWLVINVGMYNIPEWCVEGISDKKAVEHILASGDIEYEIKQNGISICKVKCDDHWYIIVKSIDELISVEEVLP